MRNLKLKALAKSPWVFHFCSASCNNCDIEILDCLTPRFDIERFGIQLVGSIRHADAMLVTGAINKKAIPILKKLYSQMPKPGLVIAIGTCAMSQHMFGESYMFMEPADKHIPVDVYIPGCPPKPEAIISGVVKALQKLG